MKVAICMWGLCRSSHLTYPFFQEHILTPLKEWGWTTDLYIHTYAVEAPYTNNRAREKNIQLDNTLYTIYPTKQVMVENQTDVDQFLDLPKYRKHPDPWNTGYQTFDNHIRALYSLKQAFSLIEEDYDYIMFCRPDVKFLYPLTRDMFEPATPSHIVLPNFCKFPINDRFAICKPTVATIYANRFYGAYDYSLTHRLHSEKYLAHTLRSAGISIHEVPFNFKRIRATGADGDSGIN